MAIRASPGPEFQVRERGKGTLFDRTCPEFVLLFFRFRCAGIMLIGARFDSTFWVCFFYTCWRSKAVYCPVGNGVQAPSDGIVLLVLRPIYPAWESRMIGLESRVFLWRTRSNGLNRAPIGRRPHGAEPQGCGMAKARRN